MNGICACVCPTMTMSRPAARAPSISGSRSTVTSGLEPRLSCSSPFTERCASRWAMTLTPRSEEHTSELQSQSNLVCRLLLEKKKKEQLTKNQAVATSKEALQNQSEPQVRHENAHNDKSVHEVLNPTYQAGLLRNAVQPDIEAERKKRDEIEAAKSYCSRRFGGATCDDKSAQIYARFDKNDWRIQPAEFYRFHDAEVNFFFYI